MERKFKLKLAMPVKTRMEYEEISQPLSKIGYKTQTRPSGSYPWLIITDDITDSLTVAYLQANTQSIYDFNHIIEEYNPELFLALAACSEGDTFYPGEWVVLHGSLYLCNGMKEGSLLLDMYEGYNFPPNNYRKATVEEIINHFTKKEEVKEPEVEQPQIGIMPRWRWLELRAIELQSAISRRIESNLIVPSEWMDEETEISKELNNLGKIPLFTIEEAEKELCKHLKVPFVGITYIL